MKNQPSPNYSAPNPPYLQNTPETLDQQRSAWEAQELQRITLEERERLRMELKQETRRKRKRSFLIFIVLFLILAALLTVAYFTVHIWTDATCTDPATCLICGAEDEALGHRWEDATCEDPKTCSECGKTKGDPEGHRWLDATYDDPKTCSECGETEGFALVHPWASLAPGDILKFGVYEQDNRSGNGMEEIEWIVLEKQDDKILVISRYALDSQRYHVEYVPVDWQDCTVRVWLNTTFCNAAFTAEEQARILDTTDPTTSATDKVFLLSLEELNKYFYSNNDRICVSTAYARAQNAYVGENGGSWWLLRTVGQNYKWVMSVNCNGSIDYDGGEVNATEGTIRPAIWLSLE